MRLLDSLASAFIDTFGITQPTDKTRRQVSWFILGLLTLVLLAMAILATVLLRLL